MPRKVNYIKIFEKLAKDRPEHATFSPSSSDKWLNCTGFYHATKDLPSTPSGKAAERGTKAHKLMEDCLLQNKHPEDLSNDTEMIDWVGYVLDFVNAYKVTHPKAQIFPETYLPWLKVSGGTIDVLGLDPKELLIVDLKTGQWPVEVEGNTQLLSYAVAARKHLGKKSTYRLVIVQPNGFHKNGPIREWVITDKDLNDYEEHATTAIVKNLVGGPRIGGGHCKWCKAEALCEARANFALAQADMNLRKDFLEEA